MRAAECHAAIKMKAYYAYVYGFFAMRAFADDATLLPQALMPRATLLRSYADMLEIIDVYAAQRCCCRYWQRERDDR